MIREEKITIKIVGRTINKYKELGYICEINDNIDINIQDISKKSHNKITAICDCCGFIHTLSLQKYWKNYDKYELYTCKKCSNIKNKMTNLEKYGTEHPLQNSTILEKLQKTNIEKYGSKNVFQNEKIKNKIKITNKEKSVYDKKNILNKRENTNIEKYGFKTPCENDTIKQKTKTTKIYNHNDECYNNREKYKMTCLEKYNVDNISKTEHFKIEIRKKYSNKMLKKYKEIIEIDYENNNYTIKCECGDINIIDINLFHVRKQIDYNVCLSCYPYKESQEEEKLYKYIKEVYDGIIIRNDRIILEGKELDIYLPELKLAFEYNGDYWHSSKFKDDNYHTNKILKCKEKNINLIHIWENKWKNKKDIIKRYIKILCK